ncbi:hypothetical protein ACFU0X_10365 [Streptomyces cellulosae]|uniref:Uncharacterized protein n=1 Tax=Streptomyces cellulosae TaxID=1968 RepID=A0ABW6JED0_STRCE
MTISTLLPSLPTIEGHSAQPDRVQQAVLEGIVANHGPETFLWINERRKTGTRIWYAWTDGGEPLGDRIDQVAVAAGLDAADWMHIADLHQRTSWRGRFETWAYPLRPVLAAVHGDERAPDYRRDGLRRVVQKAAERTGQQPRAGRLRWLGFGPIVVRQRKR